MSWTPAPIRTQSCEPLGYTRGPLGLTTFGAERGVAGRSKAVSLPATDRVWAQVFYDPDGLEHHLSTTVGHEIDDPGQAGYGQIAVAE